MDNENQVFSLLGKGITNKEKRKARMNPVVLDWRRYQYEFMVFNIYTYGEAEK